MSAQLDIFRDRKATAEEWRQSAATSLQQFPHDTTRYRHYMERAAEAERYDRMTRGEHLRRVA